MAIAIHRALDAISRAALVLSACGVVAMTAIVGWQVHGRYVLNDTPIWSERLSLLLMTWYAMLAAAVGVRERFHIGLRFFVDAAPPALRRVFERLSLAAITAFAIAMAVYGGKLASTTWSHTIPTLGLPTGLTYLAFVVSGALMALFAAAQLAESFEDRP